MIDAEEKYLLQLYRAYPPLEKKMLLSGILLAGRTARRFPHLAQRLYDVTLIGCQFVHTVRRSLLMIVRKV